MTFIEKLNVLMGEKGINQRQLSQQTGIPYSTISNWYADPEKAKNAKLGALKKLSRYFNVSLDYISEDDVSERKLPDISSNFISVNQLFRIPIIGSVRCGFGGVALEEIIGYEFADVKNPDEFKFFRIKGDSMQPHINEGDLALAHMQPDIESGELAVVIINGDEGALKKVIRQNNSLILQSFNPEYAPLIFSGSDLESVRIWGKVVQTVKKW